MTFKSKKLLFQVKYVTIVFPLLLLAFFSAPLYATAETNHLAAPEASFFEKSCNTVYEFVNNHEYLFAPLTAVVAGGTTCGPLCAIGGGLAGALDEFSIYLGWTDKRYLTWGVVGMAMGNTINPSSHISELGGFAVGVLLPTGILNDHPEFVAPAMQLIAGNQAGALYSMADQLAVDNGITETHLLTFMAAGDKVVTKMAGGLLDPRMSGFLGAILGAIASQYEEKISDNFLTPAKTAKNLYDIYSKFIPKKQLDDNIEKQGLALIGSQFLIQVLNLKLLGHEQSASYSFQHLDTPNSAAWEHFKPELVKIAIFIFPYIGGYTVSTLSNNYFDKKIQYPLEDKLMSEFFTEKTAARLANNPNTKVLSDNLIKDIQTLTSSGSNLITEAISTSIQGAYGFGIIVVTSPDLVAYSYLYNLAKSYVLKTCATYNSAYNEEIKILDSEISKNIQNAGAHQATIAAMGGLNATNDKLQLLRNASRKSTAGQERWGTITNLWQNAMGITNFFTNYGLVGRDINWGRIPFDNRFKAREALGQVSSLLSFSGDKAQQVTSIEQSSKRIMILEGILHTPSDNLDQIVVTTKDIDQLTIQDLELGIAIEKEDKLRVKELKLDMGKTYILEGPNRCGKSLLLSKIRGVTTHGIRGKGNIYYPLVDNHEPKIVMVSSDEHFEINSSLQEVIYWPDKIPTDSILKATNQKKMLELLEEIDFAIPGTNGQSIDLEAVTNCYGLNSGEKKKLMLVAAIMKKPDILLLDEVLANLDAKARNIAQTMLKRELPKALILAVDHEAQAHHYKYYDKKLKFVNKGLSIEDIY